MTCSQGETPGKIQGGDKKGNAENDREDYRSSGGECVLFVMTYDGTTSRKSPQPLSKANLYFHVAHCTSTCAIEGWRRAVKGRLTMRYRRRGTRQNESRRGAGLTFRIFVSSLFLLVCSRGVQKAHKKPSYSACHEEIKESITVENHGVGQEGD